MDIKPIRTEEEYKETLIRIDEIFDSQPGTPDGNELEVLIILVKYYEEKHYPIGLPDPIEAIEFHMERLSLTRRDLEPYIGPRSRVSEILNRRRMLTLPMIRNLNQGLGIPAEILLQQYSVAEVNADMRDYALGDDLLQIIKSIGSGFRSVGRPFDLLQKQKNLPPYTDSGEATSTVHSTPREPVFSIYNKATNANRQEGILQ